MSRPSELPLVSSPRRLLWAGLFLAWGCLLAGLLLSGRLAHYLASRNRPFVAFAAVALVAVGIASARRSGVAHSGDPDDELHELSCRCRRAQVPGSTELVSVALFLLPVVVLAVVPSGTLGASAARSRGVSAVAPRPVPLRVPLVPATTAAADGGAPTSAVSAAPAAPPVAEVTVLDVLYATQSADYATKVGLTQGGRVRLMGLRLRP